MSVWRRPKGQYVRGTGDWFFDRFMFGGAKQIATPAVYSLILLFNNATDGSFLHVIDLEAFAVGSMNWVVRSQISGFLGTTDPTTYGPGAAFGQLLPGVIYTGTSATIPGIQLGRFAFGGTPWIWAHE